MLPVILVVVAQSVDLRRRMEWSIYQGVFLVFGHHVFFLSQRAGIFSLLCLLYRTCSADKKGTSLLLNLIGHDVLFKG